MPPNLSTILALDVGTVRIGVAIASSIAKLARPETTLPNDEFFTDRLLQIIDNESVGKLVIGLPRGLNGQETEQTQLVREFVERIKLAVSVPVFLQDEALTSSKAKQELFARGKPYQKGEVDALAATYILEDYLKENEA